MTSAAMMTVWAVDGLPEFRPGDDLARILGDAVTGQLQDGDILAITSKIVSKAEGRIIQATDREDAITAETVRVVATRGSTRIVQNAWGQVMAAAGVDASNTADGTVLLLPENPDASARDLCIALRERFGIRLGVVITDTFGRPWREGQTDVALGAAGLRVVDDLRGTMDAAGHELHVTVPAVGDEIAAAADLVKGKANGTPVAVVRGLSRYVTDAIDQIGAQALVRGADTDMFSRGTTEAWDEGYRAGLEARSGDPTPTT
jgi:coenzyme F420-0:L-glutamate ligase/coenzyme F420-1:gamma-L-glutamate ligase